ncbi:sorting nexin-21-like [Panonychus citri]|uniref:sorting nexin-21-like n=1 Tax=Panonychus citri TaxID=50023 RepID=UPI002307517E|nr:sorting nexin-21-like [Panonychus citri]
MLDSYEENELIWDESDTRPIGLTDHHKRPLVDSISRISTITTTSTTTTATTTSNSSLDKSLSICFSDISSINGPQDDHNSDLNYSDCSQSVTTDLTGEPVINSNVFGSIGTNNGEQELGPDVCLDFDFHVARSFNGVSRLTQNNNSANCGSSVSSSSTSLYSYTGDERRSKSYGNLKDLDRESQVVTSANQQLAKWRDDTINCSTPRKAGYRVTFEIISARTVTTGASSGVKSKHVSYTIIIKRCPGLESQPGVIERRYTEFSSLYMGLMKRFPLLLKDFNFPKKTLVGNFTSQVIRERSIAFQSLLTYCLSVDELRTSRPFVDFLHSKEMIETRRYLKSRNFEDAANILENCFFIQEKITLQGENDQSNAQVYQILILLVTSMIASGSPQEALNYAQKAIPMVLENDYYDRHELTVPFLRLTRQLIERSGKPVDAFDRKFVQLREKGIKINEKMVNLIELIVKKDYTNLTCLRFF